MYTWKVTYSDGIILEQSVPAGLVSADDIDRSKVATMTLLKDGIPVINLHLDPEQRLIYRKRINKSVGGEDEICHILGWRQTVNAKIVQSICYYFEDGRIELAGQFRENHPWFYSPVLREFEL